MYRAIEIAKYIISKCTRDKQPISNMQLQSILYYIQKEFLQLGTEAFPEEIQARTFGPIVPFVYYKYCGYEVKPIRIPYNSQLDEKYNTELDENTKRIINPIIEKKRLLKPWDINHDIQHPEKAWYQTYKNGLGDYMTIPKSLIQSNG